MLQVYDMNNGTITGNGIMHEHVLAHHSKIFESLGHTTILATPNSLIETLAPPSYKSLSRINSAASITHASNPINTCQGLCSVRSECGFVILQPLSGRGP